MIVLCDRCREIDDVLNLYPVTLRRRASLPLREKRPLTPKESEPLAVYSVLVEMRLTREAEELHPSRGCERCMNINAVYPIAV